MLPLRPLCLCGESSLPNGQLKSDTANAMHKAIFHCHSTYSDGEFALPELRELSLAAGVDFICISDHAEAFDAAKLKNYVDECAALSDEKFGFIAGLEYNCERRMHILGYGVTSLVNTNDPQEVITHIKDAGGVAVIAHPPDEMFAWIETFETLPHGIETWNSKYDGQYAPRPDTFRLLTCLQKRDGALLSFYGQDLHWRRQPRVLFCRVECATPTRDDILQAMLRGKFEGVKDEYILPSSGVIDEALLEKFGEVNRHYMRKQKLFKRVKKMSGRIGKRLPKSLKARVRNLFS